MYEDEESTVESSVELDDYARELLASFEDATAAGHLIEENRKKARDQLVSYLNTHGARTGTVDGQARLRLVVSQRSMFDTAKFRADEPALAEAYTFLGDAVYTLRTVKA